MVNPVHPIDRVHYRAYCSDCGEIGEVCPKKLEDRDAITFAVNVLRKAGGTPTGSERESRRSTVGGCVRGTARLEKR